MVTISVICLDFFTTIDTLSVILASGILIMLAFIWAIHSHKNRLDVLRERMSNLFLPLLQDAIWFEKSDNSDEQISISESFVKFLKNKKYRNWLIEDIIKAKNSLTGIAAKNLEALYEQLDLYKDSFAKLQQNKWDIQARGIQELYLMNNKRYMVEMLQLTHYDHNYVRAEAQMGMICLNGFKGLEFLNELTLPISEWNQIRLLNHLSKMPYEAFLNVHLWLKSENDSVVIFALKFIGIYHLFDFQKEALSCLSHPNNDIKFAVLNVLQEVHDECSELVVDESYPMFDSVQLKLKALETLAVIGTSQSLPLLQEELRNGNRTIKLFAGRAIVQSLKNGISVLEDILAHTKDEDGIAIIEHLKFELQR
ncbi:hypothetical protein [Arachidicoccus sp.]|uniref:hypothetical protein n=1 Tax=Arachidicoccus sp. TaxID=1872624 RepID=UPI003D2143D1